MFRMNQKQITEKYNSYAKKYNLKGFFINFLIGRYRKMILRGVKGKILEVGIGTGANLRYYSDECEIVGIDLSKEMLKIAQSRADKNRKKIILKIASADNLPFKNKKFDYVVDTLGLCTYLNPTKALKEMKRVCKKSGRILLLEHGISNNSFVEKSQRKREKKHYQRSGCSLLRDYEKLVKKEEFKFERIERKLFGIIYIIEAKQDKLKN